MKYCWVEKRRDGAFAARKTIPVLSGEQFRVHSVFSIVSQFIFGASNAYNFEMLAEQMCAISSPHFYLNYPILALSSPDIERDSTIGQRLWYSYFDYKQ